MSFSEKFKNKKKLFIGITVIGIVGLGIYIYPRYINPTTIVEGEAEDIIDTYTIPEAEKIFINGSIVPKQAKDFTLSSEEEINKLNVTNGQVIKKGDLLYTSKNPTSIAEIDNLNVQISELKKQKSQLNQDSDPSMASSLDVEISKLNSQVASLNKKAYVNTYAPFAGKVYINEPSANNETSAQNFLSLQSTEFYMKGQASEQDLAKIKLKQSVDILVFSTNKNLTGYISYICDRPTTQVDNSMGAQGSLSYYDVNIEFNEQENLINGFHIQASIKLEDGDIKIPTSAILGDEENSYVFKDVNGILKKQKVEISNKNDEYAVITSGLKENDIIIKSPNENMKEDDPVFNDNSLNSDDSLSENEKSIGSLISPKESVGY